MKSVLKDTDWQVQLDVVGRGRGAIWENYLLAIAGSSMTELLFGHSSMKIQGKSRPYEEPHNVFLLTLFLYGLVGLTAIAGTYVSIWRDVLFHLGLGPQYSKVFIHLCFMIPLWYGLMAEPFRYPTFFAMLFVAAALIVQDRRGLERSL